MRRGLGPVVIASFVWLVGSLVGGCVNLDAPDLTMTRSSGSPRYRTDARVAEIDGATPVVGNADPEPVDGPLAPDAPAPEASPGPTPAPDAADPLPEGGPLPPDPMPPPADAAPPPDAEDPGQPDAGPLPPDAAPPSPDTAPEPPLPDAAPPPDATPDAGTPALLIDDFDRPAITLGSNNPLGGTVDWDNQSVSIVAGELRFQWTGSGGFQDFIEALSGAYCPRDLRAYRRLRFRMRASTGGKRVPIHAKTSTPDCDVTATPVLTTITVGTAMTTFEVDLGALNRAAAAAFEWSPPADSTVYFLDDVQLLP